MAHIRGQLPEALRDDAANAPRVVGGRFLRGGSLLAGLTLLAFALALVFTSTINLTAFFLNRQDRWLLLIGCGLLSLVGINLRARAKPFSAGIGLPLIVAVLLLLFCFAGHYWVLAGYDMSRDEQMATFDAAVFAQGHLVAKIPALWRDQSDVLNTIFMYPAAHRGAWISTYLPFNSILRALLDLIGAPTAAGPLMAAIGAIALWGCVRRIWPQDREAPVVALLLYVGSGQVVVTGMTAYAMPAHLTCNMVWLWLFLRRTWWTDAAALAVGFVAVGLHQPLLHPIFAAPLLFLLVLERHWPRAALYAVGYAAIGVFWLWWPGWTWSLVQASVDVHIPVGVDFATRLTATIRNGDAMGLPDMVANLLRFAAWQHLLLLPLMLLGWKIARRDRLAAGLLGGVIATTLIMAVILPYQGHGFGYRYLHGLIGNCILLAVYGWTSLDQRDVWRSLLLRSSIAGSAVILPIQLWMAHNFYAPAAEADARIAATHADYAVIGNNDAPFSVDLVHNPPALDTHPVRLIGERMNAKVVAGLCRDRPSVVLVGDGMFDRMNAYYGVSPQNSAAQRNSVLALRLTHAGCRFETSP